MAIVETDPNLGARIVADAWRRQAEGAGTKLVLVP